MYPRCVSVLVVTLTLLAAFSGTAAAHGPSTPVATSYVARVSRVPAGVNAKVAAGDLRMWLSVPAGMTLLVLIRRPGYLSLFLISLLALWEGVELVPTITHGFALTAVPAVVARASTVLCLGSGISLLLFVFRLARRSTEPSAPPVADATDRDSPDAVARLTAPGR
jgi:hypothetical protein